MMHVGKKIIFILLLTIFAIYIDLPSTFPIHVNIGQIKIDQNFQKSFFGRDLSLGLDLVGGSRITFEADTSKIDKADLENSLESLKKIIEKRVNLFGLSEANVVRSTYGNKHRVIVELPGITDTNKAASIIGKTAQLVFSEVNDKQEVIPTDLTGRDLRAATLSFDGLDGKPSVSIEFTEKGAKRFEDLTAKNISKPLLIVLDDKVISSPVVNEKITGGRAQISGNFSQEEAKTLVVQLNAGALPLSVAIVDQKTVGATLGSEAITKSVKAGVIGIICVLIFMIFIYGRLGVIAGIGIFIFAALSFAIYKIIPVVVTLPGITGFLLSVGMAVDSNILIFERFKEEKQKGLNVHIAMETAFGRAWNSIRDANVATLITAFILANPLDWQFLNISGPIRGFAFTLAIGILVGLFTGIFVSRNLVRFFIRK